MALGKRIKRYLVSFLVLVLGGYLLLVLAYCLPTRVISRNVGEAVLIFSYEDTYRQLNYGGGNRTTNPLLLGRNSTQDNFTDALMLLNAENTNDESVLVEALKVERVTSKDQFPTETLVALHTGEAREYKTEPYARYWHGYLILLKPLLLFFNYQQIRYFLSLAQLGLVTAVIWLLAAKGKGPYCVPVVMAYFFLNPAACSLSLQYTPVLVLTMAQFVVILLREDRYAQDKGLWLYHFFLAGCLTSYFDLLTYPVVTLGIPVIFLISQYEEKLREGLKELVGCCFLWGTGYTAMWAGKWILGSLITGNNVLNEALGSITTRAGYGIVPGTPGLGRLDAIWRNLPENRFTLTLTLLAVGVCFVSSLCRDTFRLRDKYIPVVLAGLLPFAWYFVVYNHSITHAWMTFRALAVFVYALMTIGVMLLEEPQLVPKEEPPLKKGKPKKS